jgi:hypothetical protein
MRIDELDRKITQSDVDTLEKFADKLFAKVGIDVEFTHHFLQRVNDERNVKPITVSELVRLFKQEFKKWGKPIANLGPDAEAVMMDLATDINMPFALDWNEETKELMLVAKTIMRKKDFKTNDRKFTVEKNPHRDMHNALSSEENDDIDMQRQNDLDKIDALAKKFAQIERGRKAKAIEDPIKYKMDADNSASQMPYKHYRSKAASYAANVNPEYYFEEQLNEVWPVWVWPTIVGTGKLATKFGKRAWEYGKDLVRTVRQIPGADAADILSQTSGAALGSAYAVGRYLDSLADNEVDEAVDEEFEPHMMYSKDGKEKMYADTEELHLELKAKGWNHGVNEADISDIEPVADISDIDKAKLKSFMNAKNKELKNTPINLDHSKDTATWVGKNSNVWNDASSIAAQKLEKAGYSREQIWKKTQNIRGTDGQWRQEVSDENARLDPSFYSNTLGSSSKFKLTDVLQHDELYKAYPGAHDNMEVVYWDNSQPDDLGTSAYVQGNTIYVGKFEKNSNGSMITRSPNELIKSLSHEWQHPIEDEEGWADGGSSGSDQSAEITANLKANGIKDANGGDFSTFDTYYSYGGEGDARETKRRINHTDQQRKGDVPKFNYASEISTIPGDKLPPGITDANAVVTNTTDYGDYITFKNPNYDDKWYKDAEWDEPATDIDSISAKTSTTNTNTNTNTTNVVDDDDWYNSLPTNSKNWLDNRGYKAPIPKTFPANSNGGKINTWSPEIDKTAFEGIAKSAENTLMYLIEGGAMPGVGAIHIDEINPTLIPLEKELGIDLRNNALGSVGKKQFSGDIDVALQVNTEDLPDFVKKLENSKLIYDIKRSSVIMTRVKIQNYDANRETTLPRTGFVQLDFMPGDPGWLKTYYHTPHENDSKYKGVFRNIMMAAIAANHNPIVDPNTIEDGRPVSLDRFMWSPRDGLIRVRRTPVPKKTGDGYTKKNSNKLIEGPWKQPNEIAQTLGLDSANDLDSFESLYNAVKKNLSTAEQEKIFTDFAGNSVIQDIGIPPEVQEFV